MARDRRFECVAIRSPRGATTTEIDWGDGHKAVYPHVVLRGYCPCAGCQGHSGTIRFVSPSPTQTQLEELSLVGNYALSLQWFDGHDTGIYSYKFLRGLCQCRDCRPPGAPAGGDDNPGDAPVDRPDLPRV